MREADVAVRSRKGALGMAVGRGVGCLEGLGEGGGEGTALGSYVGAPVISWSKLPTSAEKRKSTISREW